MISLLHRFMESETWINKHLFFESTQFILKPNISITSVCDSENPIKAIKADFCIKCIQFHVRIALYYSQNCQIDCFTQKQLFMNLYHTVQSKINYWINYQIILNLVILLILNIYLSIFVFLLLLLLFHSLIVGPKCIEKDGVETYCCIFLCNFFKIESAQSFVLPLIQPTRSWLSEQTKKLLLVPQPEIFVISKIFYDIQHHIYVGNIHI